MADTTTTDQPRTSLRQQLRDGEQHWAWKVGLRVTICVLNIIAIGCTGWLIATASGFGLISLAYAESAWLWPFLLVAMVPSFVYCLICILVLLLRRPPQPVHPGVAVGLDLVFWLAFIISGLCAIYAIFSIDSDLSRGCESGYSSCERQGAYVNKMVNRLQHRQGPTIVVGVVQWLNVILHFTLFVWACVDTHRSNAGKQETKTQAVAERVIQEMQARGMVLRAPEKMTGTGERRPLIVESRPSSQHATENRQFGQTQATQDVIETIGRAR